MVSTLSSFKAGGAHTHRDHLRVHVAAPSRAPTETPATTPAVVEPHRVATRHGLRSPSALAELAAATKANTCELDSLRAALSAAVVAAAAEKHQRAELRAELVASEERTAAALRTIAVKQEKLDDVTAAKVLLDAEVAELRASIICMHERVIAAKTDTFAARQELLAHKLDSGDAGGATVAATSAATSTAAAGSAARKRAWVAQHSPRDGGGVSASASRRVQRFPAATGDSLARGSAHRLRRGVAPRHAAPAFGDAQSTGRNARGLSRQQSVWTDEASAAPPALAQSNATLRSRRLAGANGSGGGDAGSVGVGGVAGGAASVSAAPSRRGARGSGTSYRRGTFFGTYSKPDASGVQQPSSVPKSPRGLQRPTPRAALEAEPAQSMATAAAAAATALPAPRAGSASPGKAAALAAAAAGAPLTIDAAEGERSHAIAALVNESWQEFRAGA